MKKEFIKKERKETPYKKTSGYPSRGETGKFSNTRDTKRAPVSTFADKAPYIARDEKPVYKGKESRLAGARTRNETRVFSGYTAHTPRTYSKPQSAMSPRSYTKPSTEAPKLKTGNLKLETTHWGGVADWYNKHLEGGNDTYHAKVIFPNILRMVGDVAGKKVLDLACGQGILSEQLRDKGAFVTGVDLGKELIALAEEKSKSVKEKGTHKVAYHVGSAEDLFILKDKTFDIVICVLALQNIENLQKTIEETRRVLMNGGKFIFVLNHPSFRNPKQT